MKKEVKKEVTIRIPSLPNFLLTKEENLPISIGKFSEGELQQIGEEWTKELVKKSKIK